MKWNALLTAVANGRFYGGGYEAAPLAKIDDGVLDLCYVNKLSRFQIAGLVRFYKRGEHLRVESLKNVVHYLKCKSLRITAQKALWYVLDGEPYRTSDAQISIIENAFTLSYPKSCVIQHIIHDNELSLGVIQ